jgi:hypothetical protein
MRNRGSDAATQRKWLFRGLLAATLGGACYLLASWWNRPPAVEHENLKYIQLLRTAVSAERADWVANVRVALDQRMAENAMSEAERGHFNKILALADARKWQEAHRMCFEFEEVQLSRRRQSSVQRLEEHHHDH